MEVYVLVECRDQSDYSEPDYYSSAADSCEIKGVYGDRLKALKEKARLEASSQHDQDEFDCDPCYYEVKPYTVL